MGVLQFVKNQSPLTRFCVVIVISRVSFLVIAITVCHGSGGILFGGRQFNDILLNFTNISHKKGFV